jgi:hypothetical protein
MKTYLTQRTNNKYLYVKLLFSILFLFVLARENSVAQNGVVEIDEEVIFYNTYGYEQGEEWIIPMRAYVIESRTGFKRIVTGLFTRTRGLSTDEREIFRSRIADFLADSESGEEVIIVFKNDPNEEEFRILDSAGNIVQTNLNGVVEGYISLSKERAEELLKAQESKNEWLKFKAVSDEHTGTGYIQLIPSEGLSVISDIDDTVKISGLPVGRSFVIRKTFFEEFKAAPLMAQRYQRWEDAVFHYVSGAPWQIYRPLSEFLLSSEQGFPKGTFHMKFVPKNLISIKTWSSLSGLVTNENVTFDQKIVQISAIISDFPKREFILVGDSGERDPEVYREIAEHYPGQIKEIIIRDVINDRQMNPERLEGMTIIPAPAFVRTATQ